MRPHTTLLMLITLTLTLLGAGACGSKSSAAAACKNTPLGYENGSRGEQWTKPPSMQINTKCGYTATLNTSKGAIVVKLDAKSAPLAVNNFIFLARHHFYTNILFHRVIKGFMLQTGDPQGTGMGGPGYSFKIEDSGSQYPPGTVAMANSGGTDTNGSQFFICQGTQCANLTAARAQGAIYTIFGHVTSGMNVVNTIGNAPAQPNPSNPTDGNSVLVHPVYLRSVTITESK